MKEETKQALDQRIQEMRCQDHNYKKFIVMDKYIKAIWSFNTEEQMNEFLTFYLCDEEYKFLTSYNNGKIIVIKEV